MEENTDMEETTNINEILESYEDSLYRAQVSIESALCYISPLSGDFPRNDLYDAIEKIKNAIKGSSVFYDNPDVRFVE